MKIARAGLIALCAAAPAAAAPVAAVAAAAGAESAAAAAPAVVPAAAAGAAVQTTVVEPVEVRCPQVLGVGVTTNVPFCDVLIQSDPTLAITVVLPPRRGEATLSFDLHNRHTYSEDEVRAGRAYTRYLAEVAVATATGDILARRYVVSEFRNASDLVDRVGGGAGPAGLKALAPAGVERVFVPIPAGVERVVIAGQRLELLRFDQTRDEVRTVGSAMAVISNALVEYTGR
ncbi:MAG: hypothetical protein F4Y45_10610 [Acidobacteria bacterium]|nr:hypothetical protein [Acidobacteriota bacterium]MYJ03200.1 hypothetical protein [Acidobacteriota bacterium]